MLQNCAPPSIINAVAAATQKYELGDDNAALLPMISVFVSMGEMISTPLYAENILKIYRAIQAYKSLPLSERD